MAQVTLQLLEGLERGLTFRALATPVSIGREDENSVRLNDERVSRFHAKIQEDGGQVILTDLDSTNGTRVNGHPTQMRVLQIGDQISIGRCLLLFGSPEEIDAKTAALSKNAGAAAESSSSHPGSQNSQDDDGTSFIGATRGSASRNAEEEMPEDLFPGGPPEPPRGLRPLQRAQVSDVLGYCHEQIRRILHAATEEATADDRGSRVMRLGWVEWQRLLRLEMDLAISIKKVSDPDA